MLLYYNSLIISGILYLTGLFYKILVTVHYKILEDEIWYDAKKKINK